MQTASSHAELEEYEAAEASLAKAQQYGAALIKDLEQPCVPEQQFCNFAETFIEALLDRARNAWKLQQQVEHSSFRHHNCMQSQCHGLCTCHISPNALSSMRWQSSVDVSFLLTGSRNGCLFGVCRCGPAPALAIQEPLPHVPHCHPGTH
jgi:hypothetical protein